MLWVLAGAVWYSSLGVVAKYAGLRGVVVYTLALIVSAWLLPRLQRWHVPLIVVGAVAAVGILVVVYPHANTLTASTGSDADDALNVAARALMGGRYLYGETTYLGNPIAPLPGAVLLALPFVVLFGSSAYQAIVWWPAFVLTLRGSLTVVLVTFGSVEVWHSLAVGSDGFVNGIYVALAALLVLKRPTVPRGLALGLVLSSRVLFLPVAPLVLLALWGQDRRSAVRVGLATFASFCVVTLPFYVWSPSGFSPIHTGGKLTADGRLSSPALGVAAVLFGFGAAAWLIYRDRARVWWALSLALGFPVVVLGFVALGFTSYAAEVLPFLAIAVASSTPARKVAVQPSFALSGSQLS